jgi:F-type H+-transporting ATPase subunit delta
MKRKILARRYGEAFISYSEETIGKAQAVEEFKVLRWIVTKNPEFVKFLTNLGVMQSEKVDFIEKVLNGNFSIEMRNFLKLLIAKRRINFLPDIADYVREHYAHEGSIETILKSAYPQDDDIIKGIKAQIKEHTGLKVDLYIAIDPDLKGGTQLTMGNKIIDGSVQRRLTELKEKLQAVVIV